MNVLFFHNRFIVLYKHATCSLQFFCQNISKIIATQQFYLTMWCEVLTYRESKFVAQKVFDKALFYSTINATKTSTINDQGFYKVWWKSLSKTMISTMNSTNNDKEFLKEIFCWFHCFQQFVFQKPLLSLFVGFNCIQQWIRQRILYWHTKKSWTKSEAKGIMVLHQFPAKNLMI